MLAIVFLPVFLFVHAVIVWWLFRYSEAIHTCFQAKIFKIIFSIFYTFFVLAMYIGAILPHGELERIVKSIGNYWYGVSVYAGMVVFIVAIIRFICKKSRRFHSDLLFHPRSFLIIGTLSMILILTICIGGTINARNIHTTSYDVQIDKDGGNLDELNIVLVADLHLGYNIGLSMMEQMVEKINACDPDIVVIGGDIFDNEYLAVYEPEKIIETLKQIKCKYGVYAVYGNHDCEEPIIGGFTFKGKEKKMSSPEMDDFLTAANITNLRDESVLIDDSFYLYGRPDEERPGRGIDERATPEELMRTMNDEKPILVLEHEPKELGELSDAGVDLHMAGHTHDGQLFPLNISSKIIWENSCGLLKKGDMTSIVTSGVGLYGPNMRVATISEICDIHVQFR